MGDDQTREKSELLNSVLERSLGLPRKERSSSLGREGADGGGGGGKWIPGPGGAVAGPEAGNDGVSE